MIVAFALIMILSNSAAAAFENPIVALIIGPILAVAIIVLYAVASRRIEGRTVTEVARARAGRHLLLGIGGGVLLAAAVIGTLAAFGVYRITGWGSLAGALTIVGTMCVVAVAEEVLFRGVIFRLVQRSGGVWIALAVSAVLFGLVHLLNPGATPWGALAVAIEAGLMLGAAYVATGSLWLPIGLHFGWNVAISAIFGTVVSGSGERDALIVAETSGPAWLSGGSFGPEGSMIAVLFCSLVTIALLVGARRSGRIVSRRG